MEQGIRLTNVSIASSHRSRQVLPNQSPNKGRKLQKQNSPNPLLPEEQAHYSMKARSVVKAMVLLLPLIWRRSCELFPNREQIKYFKKKKESY